MDDEEGVEQVDEVILILNLKATSSLNFQQMEDNQTRNIGPSATAHRQEVRKSSKIL